MKLRLPHKFQAALLAAIASVSFTTLSSGTQVQAAMQDAVWDFEGSIEAQTGITGLGYEFKGGTATYVDSNIFIGRDLTSTQVSLANLGQAIDISSSQYIRVTDNGYWSTGDGALKLGNTPTNDFTISVWTKLDAISGERFILGTSDGDNMGFSFAMRDGKLDFLAKAVAHHDVSNTTAPTNEWVNLTITYDAATGASTGYINGDSIGTITLNNVTFKNGGGNLGIGSGSANQKQASFDGQIASLSILSGAMTAEQVKAQAAVAADTLGTYTWSATAEGSDWADAVWTKDSEGGQYFQNIGNAVFGADAAVTTVGVRSTTHAHDVTLGGTYTFNLGNGVELTMNKLTLENAASAAFNSTGSASMQIGTVAGPGTVTAGQGVDIRAYNINAGSGTVTIAGAGSVTTTEGASGNVAVSSGATWKLGGSGNWTYSGVLSGAGNIEKIGAGSLTLSAANTFTGALTISEGTVKVGNNNALGAYDASRLIEVAAGGTLDVNGYEGGGSNGKGDGYTVTLSGGTLTNTGTPMESNKRQYVTHLNLTADSKVVAAQHFGLIGSNYAATSMNLGGHTLTIEGPNTYYVNNATITGGGQFKVASGTLNFNTATNDNQVGSFASNFELAGGTLAGRTLKLANDIYINTTGNSTMSLPVQRQGHDITFKGDANLTVSGNLTGVGAIAKEGAGALTLSGSLDVNSTILLDGGSLALGGTVTVNSASIGSLEVFDDTSQTYSYAAKNSGFLTSAGQYYLVKGGQDTTATLTGNVSGATVVAEPTKQKGAGDIIITFESPSSTTYYVNEDMDTRSDVTGDTNNLLTKATDVSIKKGVTLTAFSSSDSFTNAAKLHGEGTYALASGSKVLNGNLSLGNDWTGRVVLSGTGFTDLGLNYAAAGTAGALATAISSVELKGVTGWMPKNHNANIILTNPSASASALKLTNGSSGPNGITYFTGSISGSGDFEHAWNKTDATVYFVMQGDLSQWTGNIIKSQPGPADFTFDNNPGGTIAVGAMGNSGTLNINVTNNAPVTLTGNFAKGNGTLNVNVKDTTQATFTGSITNANLSVNAGASATMATDATITGITNNGTLEIAKEKTLTFYAANYNANIGKLKLDDGATLLFNNQNRTETHTIGSITLADGATGTINHKDPQFNAKVNIGTLVGDSDSTLNLWTTAKVSNATVYEMNGGDGSNFNGTIVLSQKQGGTRRLAMNINSGAATQLQNSIVKFSGSGDSDAQVGLGVNAENVTVGGIVSDTPNGKHYIFSGAASTSNANFDTLGDNQDRTLTINTGDSAAASYSTRARVGSHLSLVKEGQGTQTFSGDMSAFSGNITVSGGTLALTSAVAGANAVAVNGGTLDLGAALTTTGNLSVASGATLKLAGAGADLLSVHGDLTLGGNLDVSNITYTQGATVTLASYTGSANIAGATLTGLGSHEATLSAANNALTLIFNDTPVPPGPEFGTNLGNVMYVGDSITHGVNSGSYRWSLFQILRDAGIAHNDCGPLTGNWSGGVAVGTLYGGESFSNKRTAIYGAHAYEISDTAPDNCPNTSRNDTVWNTAQAGEIYANTSINNWLGLSDTKRLSKGGGTYEGEVYDVDTFLMLIGTNDILTDAASAIKSNYETAMPGVLSKLLGATQAGEHSFTFEPDASNTSSVVTIWKSMMASNPDAKVVFMSVPTLGAQHGNASEANIMKAVHVYNEALEQWCTAHGVRYVQSDTGIVDVSNALGAGVRSMFQNDGTHPSFQGDLIFAGNIAKAMGYAGRTIGLDRSATTGAKWAQADSTSIAIASGTSQTVAEAEGAFSELFGYTVDFGATYGNGAEGDWSASSNALTIQIGDGSRTGTLKVSEAYIMWDDSILYSRDNHLGGDNLRIAYVNSSLSSSDNVTAGYYVWLGDQLIGEKLEATPGSLNGITLSSSGASGIISNLSWSDTAYAPLSNGFVNPDDAALFHLVQVSPNPNHDNLVSKSLEIDFTNADPANDRFGTNNQEENANLLLKRTSAEANAWFGPVGAPHTGGVSILYSEVDATSYVHDGVRIGSNIFGAYNGGVTDGNVSVVLDNGTHLGYGTYDGTGNCSIIGTYQQSIDGDFRVEINNATLDGGIIMGVGNGDGQTVENTLLYINRGASIGGDVFGGNYSNKNTNTINGDATIYITGGTINGSVYGGNKKNGIIAGGTNITITGGIITGDVNGGGTGGTITGNTNVTIEGNLPSIGGSISADYVTLKGVALNTDGYTDGFDYYTGTITGTETITLDKYTVDHLRAALVTKTLVLSNESITTIHNLTLTACTITAQEGTSVTLADSLTLGNTANFSGDVSFAEEGITIDVSALTQGSQADRITLFSGAEGSKLGGLSDLSLISVTGSGSEDYHLAVGNEGQYLYLDRNTAALIPWHDSSENVIGFSGEGQTAVSPDSNHPYVAGAHVQAIDGHTGTGVYTSVTSGTGVGALYANQGAHTGDVYMLVNGVTMVNNSGAYGWIAAHNSGMLTGDASVKVENTGNGPAMLFGVVSGNVTGNVYTEVDDGTFASFTTKEAKASYAGSYQGTISGEARLVTAGGTFEYDVYGGVYTGNNSIGSTTLDLRGGTFNANVYGGGLTGSVTNDTNVTISGIAVVNGSVYGGGNGGTVGGSTNVTISGNDAQVLGNVYGNTASAQGGTVTLQNRTNGFSNTGVILTEALNLQNTQGTVSSQITAETVHLTDNSTATINSLTLTPTSAADTCALTMDTGSALTLGGTLSLSKAANYSGSLALTDGMTLDLSRMQLTGYEEGPVTLLSSNNGALTYHDLTSYDLKLGHAECESYSLSVDSGNNLVLTFTPPTPADSLIWDGTQNSNWSTDPDELNWHAYEAKPGTSAFSTGRKVTFNEVTEVTPSVVVLTEDISSGNIAVRDGANVTLHTDPLVAHSLATPRLSVADGSTLTVDANVALTTGTITGSGTVSLRDGTKLELTDGVDNNGTLNVGGGAIVKLAGTGDDMLAVQNLNLGTGSVIDVSNIEFTDGNTVKIADIGGRLDFPSRNPEHGVPADLPVARVAVTNYQGDLTDVVHLVYAGSEHQSSGIFYYTDAELFLVKENPGLYWNNRDINGHLADGVWDADYDYTYQSQTKHHDGVANWNSVLDRDATNKFIGLQQTAYFISEDEDSTVTITVAPNISSQTGKPSNTQVATMVIGGGGTFNFVRQDPSKTYDIIMSSNKATSLIVREGTTAHFEMNVTPGEYSQFEIEQNAVLDILDSQYTEAGGGIIHNQGLFNYSTAGYIDLQAVVNEGVANIGRVWDEDGQLLVPDLFQVVMQITRVYNEPGAEMTLSADQIMQKETSGCIIQNEGELTFRTDEAVWGMYAQVPVSGMGVVKTVGTAPIYFNASTGRLPATVDGSALEAGAKLTDFSNRVTITDTTTLTAEDFVEDEDNRSTTVFHYSSQLGEHVVMGGNTTLDLNTGSQENPVYTMGEVHSATADTDQNLIVRSGVTANVAGNVSLPDGKAQVAGGGKLTIGGATSTVGELAATGGGTAVVELNGATAEGTDLVLNAKRLSNTDSTSEGAPVATNLRVVNTKAVDTKSAQFNIGDATPEGGDYKGTLQYGVGAGAASGSGMNLTIKDNNVAAGAILEAYYDPAAPQSGSVNVIVDTDAAKVVGLSDNISGPDPDRSMSVSGSGNNTAETGNNGLEITGNDDYEYAGKLGANLDIAYTGDGSQTIQGGVSNFNGAVTVDNGTTEEGVLAILNASSVSITDLTIGANDKLNVKQDDQGSQADGMTTVTGTLTARGGTGNASKLDSDLTMDDGSTLDVSVASGTGGLNLMGTLTINDGAQLSTADLAGVKGLGWFEMYDLAFSVTEMLGFDAGIDWSQGVDATTVFSDTGLNKDEYYVRYSQGEMGGNGNNVGAVYIYRIPEPTTSTLSLLALAALAARRRRKG